MSAQHASVRPWRKGPLPWSIAGSLVLAGLCALFGSGVWYSPGNNADDAQISPDQPISQQQVQTQQDLSLRGEYTAMSQGTDEAREQNVRMACEALDGVELASGDTLSFNAIMGDTTTEPWVEAPVVSGNSLTVGRGGGICQVSTALYVAALKADLQIVERHPHTLATDYAPLGLDATVSYGELDLLIQNNTPDRLVIRAESSGQTCTVRIFGVALPENEMIEVAAELTDRYVDTDSDGNEAVFYATSSYRVLYRDGVVAERELLAQDVYRESESVPVELSEGGVEAVK